MPSVSDAAETSLRSHPGRAALTLNLEKTRVYLRADRAACKRLGEALVKAASAAPGALQTGSEEAEELTNYLNESLGGSEVAFGEVALDEFLPNVRPESTSLMERVKVVGAVVVTVVFVVALVRGLVALVDDAWAAGRSLLW